MTEKRRTTNEARIMEEMRAGALELGVNLDVGRERWSFCKRHDRGGLSMTEEQRMTKEEQILKRIREAGVEAYKIPDERLPKGRTQITFFGETQGGLWAMGDERLTKENA